MIHPIPTDPSTVIPPGLAVPEAVGYVPSVPAAAPPPPPDPYSNHQRLLEIFNDAKQKCFDSRWVWEREWLRDIYYTIGRQWIHYHPARREWVNKRLRSNTPRPVTNKCAEIIQALRASFGAIALDVAVRPVGNSPQSIATAEIADQMSPILHEEHNMSEVMREVDFWSLVTGNAAIQVSWDRDKRFNRKFVPSEKCQVCGTVSQPLQIIQAGNRCPVCQTPDQFERAIDPVTGKQAGTWEGFGKGKTTALSPFEYALPGDIVRFSDAPYIIRIRWRDKSYFEANFPEMAHKIPYTKTATDRSIQIFRSLSLTNDVGSGYNTLDTQGASNAEGIAEYEFWQRPNAEFPEGLVMRVLGDTNPVILTSEEEGLPGAFPFQDVEGNPIFPFSHAVFEHVGGRLYGRSILAPLISKQDQINQLDSLIQQIMQRTANPVWTIPEGAGIKDFTGEPGLVLRWNPLSAAGTSAEPKRVQGQNIPNSLFRLREQYLQDIEELSGAFDILKGARPQGVEAFSSLQLLVERSQARFTTAFASRGELYRDWYEIALELERKFGPDRRTQTLIGHNKGFTFRQFEQAQLQGSVDIKIEDGTNVPKTPLGRRAAIEHASQLGLLNPQDPDQRYTLLTDLGVSELSPALDIHVQAALRKQDEFEQWVAAGGTEQIDPALLIEAVELGPNAKPIPTPLEIKPWHDPMIHQAEATKWLNTDSMQGMMKTDRVVEILIMQYLTQLDMILNPPMNPPHGTDGAPVEGAEAPPPDPSDEKVGAARAMQDSNREAGSPTIGEGSPAVGG